MPGVKTQPLDRIDQELLNLVQVEFPVVPAPFASLAETLGVGEDEVVDRLGALKKNRIIRQISAIFDTRALGYKSSLVATRAPADRVDQVAAVISDHPGVSHNYRRDHEFNIWWTVAVPPTSSLEENVDALHALAGAEATRLMQTIRMFKIGVDVPRVGEGRRGARQR